MVLQKVEAKVLFLGGKEEKKAEANSFIVLKGQKRLMHVYNTMQTFITSVPVLLSINP